MGILSSTELPDNIDERDFSGRFVKQKICGRGHDKTKKGATYGNGACKQCHYLYMHHKQKTPKGKEQQHRYRAKLKKECLNQHGGATCSCCGEPNIAFLTLDHINNDGNKERQQLNTKGSLYGILKRSGYPHKDRYQVLCFNCNCAKSVNGGVCPHKEVENGSIIKK